MDVMPWLVSMAGYAAPGALVFARFSAIFIAAPIIGGGQMPFQVKALISLALTVAVMPSLDPVLREGIPGPLYPLALIRELGTGLIIGFLFGLFMEAVRFAGDLIGRTAGFAAAEFFNPDAGTMEGPLGTFFWLSIALLFFAIDAHLTLIAMITQSFYIIPLGGLTVGPQYAEVVSTGLTTIFEIALTISIPIEGAVLAITVAEGVIARAVPQINILAITFAVKILTVIALLVIAIPAIVMFMGFVLALAQDFTYGFIQATGIG